MISSMKGLGYFLAGPPAYEALVIPHSGKDQMVPAFPWGRLLLSTPERVLLCAEGRLHAFATEERGAEHYGVRSWRSLVNVRAELARRRVL